MANIDIRELSKSFGVDGTTGYTRVLSHITLHVKDGDFLTFFGPNGCGKTTFLKTIAGIIPFESGSIEINSKSPSAARTGFIFQEFSDSLMPWLTARDNILFPYKLRKRRLEYSEAEDRLHDLLEHLKLQLPLDRYPYEMSGGQQQLAAILRTLIYKPDVILMDEPFSALDFQTRIFMQDILLEMWRYESSTIMFVSHDIEEAVYLADRVILFTPLPAKLRDAKDVPFPRDRDQSIKELSAFTDFKNECLRVVFSR